MTVETKRLRPGLSPSESTTPAEARRWLVGLLRSITGLPLDAVESVVQTLAVKVPDFHRRPRPWLRRAATNTAIDYLRRRKPSEEISPAHPDPRCEQQRLEARNRLRRIREALRNYDHPKRLQCFYLMLRGLSSKEIAGQLDMPERTVRYHNARIKAYLRRKLGEQ